MAESNSESDPSKANEVSNSTDISEEDLKLIKHLTWLYGGYKMRSRSENLNYNEAKIFRKTQRDLLKFAKQQKYPKKKPSRPKKINANPSLKNESSKLAEPEEPNSLTTSKRTVGKSRSNTASNQAENSTKGSREGQSSQTNESECSFSNSDAENYIKMKDPDNQEVLSPQSLNSEDINQKFEDVRYLLNRRLRFGPNSKLKERRRPTWPRDFTLQDKIEYFISKKISDSTEFRIKEPTTLSICDQFALQNHEAMVADSDRVHYYRAAIFWTGHTNKDHSNAITLIPEVKLTNEDNANIPVINDNDNFDSKQYTNLTSLEEFDHILKGEVTEGSETNSEVNINTCLTNLSSFETTFNNLASNQPPSSNCFNNSTYLSTTALNINSNSNLDNCSLLSNKEYEEINTNYYCYNKKILEIGTGPMCVLAMNALKAGAKSVDALEFSVHASRLAGKLMAAYGFDNVIKVFNTHSKLFTFDQNTYFSKFTSKFNPSLNPNTPKSGNPNVNFSYNTAVSTLSFSNSDNNVNNNNNSNNNNNNNDSSNDNLNNNTSNNNNTNNNNTINCNNNNVNSNNTINTNNNMSNDNSDSCERLTVTPEQKDEGFELLLPSHPPYDMVISEILGDFASQEGVADVFLDFQRRILFENKRFVDTVKSIPCKASTMFVPSFFPDASNITNKSSADSEMTIFSPSKKMLQSVGMRIDNLPICNEWLPLEVLELEKWMLPQMCQHYLSLFKVSSFGDVAGLLVGIDVEIRPGEHFGTRYGQCESWYTNLVLFDKEYTVFENDLIIVTSVANLTNYVKVNCDANKISVSRPSYSFQVYILSPIKMILSSLATPNRIQLNQEETPDPDGYHTPYLNREELRHLNQEELLSFNEVISSKVNSDEEQKDTLLGDESCADYNKDSTLQSSSSPTMLDEPDTSRIRFHDNLTSHNLSRTDEGENKEPNFDKQDDPPTNDCNVDNEKSKSSLNEQPDPLTDNSNDNDNNQCNKDNEGRKFDTFNSVSNGLSGRDKEDIFSESKLDHNLFFSKIEEKEKFNLDSLFLDSSRKDPVLRTSVRLPCRELSEMTYDLEDFSKINLKKLNKEYDCLGTSCAFPLDVLGDFEYAHLLGEIYKVIHKPPVVHIDYSEQTSTIYYDTPCAKRKMHTDPPKRYSKIKLKTSKPSI